MVSSNRTFLRDVASHRHVGVETMGREIGIL